jgi:hypothetical protein
MKGIPLKKKIVAKSKSNRRKCRRGQMIFINGAPSTSAFVP